MRSCNIYFEKRNRMYTAEKGKGQIAMIVAHPDDETLWAGGTLLCKFYKGSYVLSLCRGSDSDRAPRFHRALKELGVKGSLADLDDGPEQNPLDEDLISRTIMENLPDLSYERIYTHSPHGEYTRHLRHEETGRAVLKLWLSGVLKAREILLFAYEDGGHAYLPQSIEHAPVKVKLSELLWRRKYKIITEIYNFNKDSFEARTTPEIESFWIIRTHDEARDWLMKERSL
jgi:LmbE family N-acetylglucosaminyl deacetylase